MNILPTEFLLAIAPMTVLSLALAAVAVSYIFLLIRLDKSEKDKVYLQSKIRDHASDILKEAHEKRLKIINEAVEKARSIIKETETFNIDVKAKFNADLYEFRSSQEKLLTLKSEELSRLYEQFTRDVRRQIEEQFKIIAKNTENQAINGIGELREILEAERVFMRKQLEVKVDEEYKKSKQHIEEYKIDQMKKIDKKVFDVLQVLIREVLGKSISLKEHEELVQKALSNMQTEINSSV